MKKTSPPHWATKLLARFADPNTSEEVQGDLLEMYQHWVVSVGERDAKFRYIRNVIKLMRPFARNKKAQEYSKTNSTSPAMIRNYLKIAIRNLTKNKGYSAINIGGLATGMAVAMMIGLWIYDEFSFNKYHQNYNRIAKVMQTVEVEGTTYHGEYMPAPLGNELRTVFADDFKYVVMSSFSGDHIVAHGDKKFTKKGIYMSPEAPEMFSLKMLRGTRAGLHDPYSIMLSEGVATVLFGTENPIGKIVKLNNSMNLKVTGVYENLPYNTEFRDMTFIAPWDLYVSTQDWVKTALDNAEWDNNSWQILAQINPKSDFESISRKIRDIKLKHSPKTAYLKPAVYLQPMAKWHLYTGWDSSGNLNARIQYVWLFGIIGIFVLLLAAINFMNLSTARSEKRAKEVGIRKAIGSMRGQLVGQFLSESLLVVACAFLLSILLVVALLPSFNSLADKQIAFIWDNPMFWLAGILFCLITGIISGSYPALYLSSFQPVKVLKGTFSLGRYSAVPRKVLVVLQFTVSVTLIIGTIIVYRQIQHAKNRPIGFDRNGLITVNINTPELYNQYNVLRSSLHETGAIVEMSTSSAAPTQSNSNNGGFEWEGKDPNFKENFTTIGVTHDYGKTVGWQFIDGRDFSRTFSTDSSGMVLNEACLKYMSFKKPSDIIGKTVKWNGKPFTVVGVIKDMLMESPFELVRPAVFMVNYGWANVINIKLNPSLSAHESLEKITSVFLKLNPGSPFDYSFADQQFAVKFATEERIARLAAVFAVLAILISCLGLFGLASFTAEQRTKEIGIRKVLGASVPNLWALLSKDFVLLVIISCIVSIPLAWYLLNNWLLSYKYRTEISWWIFAVSALGALSITLLTVSYQAIRAARLDPVKSLKTE
ncbi:ABC transporter permease [Dyadobacter psychrophilus]|uniref:ABC-type antimicrobial peptide transport system, permease component n=1 Tax=Dyadobacter psychrophilus TaxID=651661 RepID=A0A1T5E6W0_9BACT|nr:ABC transporter permease [Dyadobacter psychrophilus]SKB79609.1 ABC-type antimicrobial peptide transport system, permease component [Dyadobacter psychrophilus]